MSQSRQYHLFARLLNLTCKENLVEDCIDLSPSVSNLCHLSVHISFSRRSTHFVEIEHQVQLTNIPEERIQHLHEKVYSFQIRQFIIVCINARAEEEASVSAVYDLGHVAELDEVGLVLLVARGYEAMDLLYRLAKGLVMNERDRIWDVYRLEDGRGRRGLGVIAETGRW
jgi:hypothetical protein